MTSPGAQHRWPIFDAEGEPLPPQLRPVTQLLRTGVAFSKQVLEPSYPAASEGGHHAPSRPLPSVDVRLKRTGLRKRRPSIAVVTPKRLDMQGA